MMYFVHCLMLALTFTALFTNSYAQHLDAVSFDTETNGSICDVTIDGKEIQIANTIALFSYMLDGEEYYSENLSLNDEKINISIDILDSDKAPFVAKVRITNTSDDTLKIENFIPFGKTKKSTYIEAVGPWSLARPKLFRPDKKSLGVTLPDNAWEMGYASLPVSDKYSIVSIARRTDYDKNFAKLRRYHTDLYPDGWVEYTFYMDAYKGEWQNGLKLVFQKEFLYDVENFDNSLYERPDLDWIRHTYLMYIEQSWDHDFYDSTKKDYKLFDLLKRAERLMGGYEVYHLWPTWPMLGIDERNQFDLHKDLPGGLPRVAELFAQARKNFGTKLFITYNPWDESTREQDHLAGLEEMLKKLNADGVILDTYGSSSEELQQMADGVRDSIVMYSEGMAVPKDMQGIISGRVHDAIRYQPILNLNKLIKPDFAFFRVLQLVNGRFHREAAISLFNGYGHEINVMIPGRPEWREEEEKYLGKVTMHLRNNSNALLSKDWNPLIPTLRDSIWVNRFPLDNKIVYTIFSLIPAGCSEPLFEADAPENYHYVDLWNGEEIEPDTIDKMLYIPVFTDAFHHSFLGTRREGSAGIIAAFPELLSISVEGDSLSYSAEKGTSIKVWANTPSYQNELTYADTKLNNTISLFETFGMYEGKFVVQLFDDSELIDQRTFLIDYATPRLISHVSKTEKANSKPEGMTLVPSGSFTFYTSQNQGIVPYPFVDDTLTIEMNEFYIDIYPVTNAEYKKFIDATNYRPDDAANFLKHWDNAEIPEGMENHPVVYISYEDAQAYAKWAGKRLPTQQEWQYAAMTQEHLNYPWGNDFDSTKCNYAMEGTSPVDKFPNGANPQGIMDLVGNVWQLTNDLYNNTTYNFVIMKGGSYFEPTSSWWYIEGGVQPLHHQQMIFRLTPGYERSATVGFRCVKDK